MRAWLLTFVLIFTGSAARASSEYRYDFQFSNITSDIGSMANFEVVIDSAYLLNSTTPLAMQSSLATPLSYSINYFAGNSSGQFVFSQNAPSVGANYIGFDLTTFAFGPNLLTHGYYGLGTYQGQVMGNNPYSFSGNALLTVTQVDIAMPQTPEPSSIALLATGLAALLFFVATSRWRRSSVPAVEHRR